MTDACEDPARTLRVTADPVFGEAFLTELLIEYARTWPEVHLDVVLTRRRVDLIEEGFDVAFRIGQVDEATLSAVSLGPARVRYCSSPDYVARFGSPKAPEDLKAHACLVIGTGVRWPFPGKKGPRLLPVSGKHAFSSFTMARAAARAGLGIAIFPEFACVEDLREGRLVSVLDGCLVDVGVVCLVHAARRFLPARVRAFVALVRECFGPGAPWLVESSKPKRRTRKPRPAQE